MPSSPPSSNPVNPCLKVCTRCQNAPLAGVTVSFYDGSTLIASCTTDSTGCCNPGITGSYTAIVSSGSEILYTGTIVINVIGITTIGVFIGNGYICCNGIIIPATLTATSSAGTFPVEYTQAAPGGSGWWGCIYANAWSRTVAEPGCVLGPAAVQPVRVCYKMTCNPYATPPNIFSLQRMFGYVYQGPGNMNPINYADGGMCPAPTSGCSPLPPPDCGVNEVTVLSNAAAPTSTSPFAITFVMPDNPHNPVPDPDAGNVMVSS